MNTSDHFLNGLVVGRLVVSFHVTKGEGNFKQLPELVWK